MKEILRQFMRKESGPLVQFIKYGIAGGIATVTHITAFYLSACLVFPALNEADPAVRLLGFPVAEVSEAIRARNALAGNVLAFFFSNITAYLINILWVFESGRHHRILEILMFLGVSAISMFIGTSVMTFLIAYFGMTTTAAFGANVVSAVMINYVVRKYFIFKR
jgi:putative flippase GtrA